MVHENNEGGAQLSVRPLPSSSCVHADDDRPTKETHKLRLWGIITSETSPHLLRASGRVRMC